MQESNLFITGAENNGDSENALKAQIADLQNILIEKEAVIKSGEREIEIERSLEKVRARTNSMQKSAELLEVTHVIAQQLEQLGLHFDNVSFGINNQTDGFSFWMSAKWQLRPTYIHVPYISNPAPNRVIEAQKKGIRFFTDFLNEEENKQWVQHIIDHSEVKNYPEKIKNYLLNSPGYTRTTFILDNINFYIGNYRAAPYSEKDIKVFERFARVFEQSYTRFLDLENAEQKAREAQIEVALERIRARTMAMQNSGELNVVIGILYQELLQLDVHLDRCFIITFNPGNNESFWWMASGDGIPYQSGLKVPFKNHPPEVAFINAWKERKTQWLYVLEGDEKRDWDNYIFRETELSQLPNDVKHNMITFKRAYLTGSFQAFGCLSTGSHEKLSEASTRIITRFAKVFDQTYTRFLDLQKAEAQIREAFIEASLEKVRSRSLAMHKSEELPEVAAVLFEKLKELQFSLSDGAVSILLFKDNSRDHEQWIVDPVNVYPKYFFVPYTEHSIEKDMFDARENGLDFFSRLYPKEEKNRYFNFLFETNSDYRALPDEIKRLLLSSENYGISVAYAKKSGILIPTNSGRLIAGDDIEILKRFSRAFEQAYVRFLDLQKAEMQVREAQIEAGLERVRSRTLAMQKSDELAETAAVLFRQLINLGIAPSRLYIGIITDETGHIEFWITDEDGSRVSTMFAGEAAKNASLMKIFEGWKRKKCQVIDMRGDELTEYFHYLGEELHVPFKDVLTQKRRIQYLAYFSKGFIGLASPEEQPESTLQLLERFAYVFNLTFTRFNDLKIAEAHAMQAAEDLVKLQTEKKRAEDALTELRAAQKQLIQSEKMASLGELTAGIAHEIQNPLNFVNNFSEVNKEMLSELREEIARGDLEAARMIADDLIANEEKINHHGKRADAIVKGMLEHSRSGASEKQPTDINALTDEYTRLCYHGLRAKDKSFNCQIKTDYDDSIGMIEIIPKDVGRVILNIVSNAFHAVSERKKSRPDQYEPIVTVGTEKEADKVRISVKDNGNGVAEKNLDKIFQPFFTTKPTGQGTGLGLSLSYDIIKAHGGEIKVQSREGEGTTFFVILPV